MKINRERASSFENLGLLAALELMCSTLVQEDNLAHQEVLARLAASDIFEAEPDDAGNTLVENYRIAWMNLRDADKRSAAVF